MKSKIIKAKKNAITGKRALRGTFNRLRKSPLNDWSDFDLYEKDIFNGNWDNSAKSSIHELST